MQGGRHDGIRYRPKVLQLPKLSLSLTSVKLIVDKFEEDTRTVQSNAGELVKYDPNVAAGYDDFPFDESKGRVWKLLIIYAAVLSKCIPSVSYGNIGVLFVVLSAFGPKMLSYLVLYPLCRLVFGTLYPAYASYKAVRTKNLKEYVKWMMYWIVFALFTCTETFTDMFLSWFPFYYEVKIVLVLWLLSPATKGSSFLYRKFVHPALCRREQEIDEYIAKAKDQGYHTVLNLGTKGVNYATTVIMQTAIKGGGGLVQQIRKSYSLSDLSECEPMDERSQDEADDVMTEPRLIRRSTVRSGYTTRRSASESNSRSPIYFPEVDVDVRPRNRSEEPDFGHIKSSEDISSGYSSADNSQHLTRTGSVGASTGNRIRARPTTRSTITSIKRPQAAEDDDVIIEELPEDDSFEYTNMPPLLNVPSCPPQLFISKTNPPFIYQCIGDEIKIIQVLDSVERQQITESNENNAVEDVIKQDVAKPLDVANKLTNKDIPIETDNHSSKDTKFEDSIDTLKIEKEIASPTEEITDKTNASENIDLANYKNEEMTDCTSIDTTSILESNSADSDDEASFGTPDNSPRTKRKLSPRIGKYGKSKAPPPPQLKQGEETDKTDEETDIKENLTDYVNTLSSSALSDVFTNDSKVLNPIAENKMRHKSKSPHKSSKRHGSTIGKLLQIPGKMAFWSKGSSKSDVSNSSGDNSRRSSTIDKADEFQSITDLNAETSSLLDDQISFKDAIEIEEKISKEIIDKSDELQKLIEAKLESHPEYKMISLHPDDMVGSSKSTDV